VKDELVRLDDIPLFVRLVGVTSPGRGVQVEVELDQVDELTLTVSCKLIALKKGTPTRLLDDDEEEDVVDLPESPDAPIDVVEAGESEGVNTAGDSAA
jgi:exoribonuclease II